jgi:hypothetical protein
MQPQELEPEVEAFLLRLVPQLSQQWRGATDDQIAEVENIAGRPLPRFYRWFLMRMGMSVGSLWFRSLDLSIDKILSSYREGLVDPDPRFLMIGFETDNVMPLHLFYDFDHPDRDDARVISMDLYAGPIYQQFDTLREMLTVGQFVGWRIRRLPQSCVGLFRREVKTLSQLDGAMERLGFSKPNFTGPNCAIYERADMAMSIYIARDDPPSRYASFRVGGPNAGTIRRVLGIIASDLSLEVKVNEWSPPLVDPDVP